MQDTNSIKPHIIAARIVLFLAIISAVFVYLNLAFVFKGTTQTKGAFEGFYALEDNTLDVMYIGSSAASRYFISPLAYEEAGISAYTLGPNGSPLYYVKYLIQETEKTQNPDLYVVELRSTTHSPKDEPEGQMRNTLDMMDLLSENRLGMAREYMRIHPELDTDLIQLLVPIIKYHSRLLEGDMTVNDFALKNPMNRTMGFPITKVTLTQSPQSPDPYSEAFGEVDEDTQRVVDDLLDYCESIDANILFVMSPYEPTKKRCGILNSVEKTVRDRGFDIINCCHKDTFDAIGLDWSTDFYNHHHTNYLGAEKYTRFITSYMTEHYDLEDHRGDPKYENWERAYQTYADYVADGIKYFDDESDE